MAEFGDNTVSQTTLALMFPISYSIMRDNFMSSRTPQPMAPLPPERVRPLITGPFSLTYTGSLKIADLNTELLFLARSLCSAVQQGPGGFESLLIGITFTNVFFDDITVPLVIQGLVLSGNLIIQGSHTLIGILQIGYCSIHSNLAFDPETVVASLEIYECQIKGAELTLPSSAGLTELLIFGQYPQISLTDVGNPKAYPVLKSLLYLNGVDGRGDRDVPIDARGFGAFTLNGLTQTSYPQVTTLALPDPWNSGSSFETLFPNLTTLYSLGYSNRGPITIPTTPLSKYTMLNLIGANDITNIDLTGRAGYLSSGIRIVGCPLLTGVMLRMDPLSTSPPREYRNLIIERCGLLYLRGTRGIIRPPSILRLGDHIAPPITTPPSFVGTRLLDYVLKAAPTIGGSGVAASATDYLPNVFIAIAEAMPTVVLYPVMQTVEYSFLRPPGSNLGLLQSSSPTTTFTQYSGGSNPVVPLNNNSRTSAALLTGALITVSPFGLRYTIKIDGNSTSSISQLIAADSSSALNGGVSIRGSNKGVLFSNVSNKVRENIFIALSILLILIIIIIVSVVLVRYYSKRSALRRSQAIEFREKQASKDGLDLSSHR